MMAAVSGLYQIAEALPLGTDDHTLLKLQEYIEDGLDFQERKAKLTDLFNRKYKQKLIDEIHLLNAQLPTILRLKRKLLFDLWPCSKRGFFIVLYKKYYRDLI